MIGIIKRLLSKPSPIDLIEKKLGRKFKDRALLIEALTHSSYAREHKNTVDNERLEFLGDAVLQLVATEYLFSHEGAGSEGVMTKQRAALVSGDGLLRLAERLGISEYILLGRGEKKTGGSHKRKILENCVEAVIGAVYLDGGLKAARRFLLNHWSDGEVAVAVDPKTEAQEVFQRELGSTPRYRVSRTTGPAHARRFNVEMLLGAEVVAKGEGSSIKSAEQMAASRALATLPAAPARPKSRE
ncbi:MAG: ribonuclease III [Acidobacteriota bacterium]